MKKDMKSGRSIALLTAMILAVSLLPAAGFAAHASGIDTPAGGDTISGTVTIEGHTAIPGFFDIVVCPNSLGYVPRVSNDNSAIPAECTLLRDDAAGPVGPSPDPATDDLASWDTTLFANGLYDVAIEVFDGAGVWQDDEIERAVIVDNVVLPPPDTTPPVINSVEVEHEIIDLESFAEGGSAVEWIDCLDGSPDFVAQDDDTDYESEVGEPYPLPFTFPYFGLDIVAIDPDTNGEIELLEEGETCDDCDDYGTHYDGDYIDSIFALNDDLDMDSSDVGDDAEYGLCNLGDKIVVEWRGSTYLDGSNCDWGDSCWAAEDYPIHFQVVMHENGDIQWNFRTLEWSDYDYDLYSGLGLDGSDEVDLGYEQADPASYIYYYDSYEIVNLGGGNDDGESDAEFYDPKCTYIIVDATDDEGVSDVNVDIGTILEAMFARIGEIEGFDSEAYSSYLADEMHDMPAAELWRDGTYRYWFCPAVHTSHLLDSGVLPGQGPNEDYSGFEQLLSEKLILGEFDVPVAATDDSGNTAESSGMVTIVDLTVPVQAGWNLRSTPITLEGNKIWRTSDIDAVLRFNALTQSWELVTDDTILPGQALYMHAAGESQFGIIFEREPTTASSAQFNSGWNLFGPMISLTDTWYWPDERSCSADGYSPASCYLTWLQSPEMCAGRALSEAVYAGEGIRGVDAVISPYHYLSYGDSWGSWWFFQDSWAWVPVIEETGARPVNQCTTKEEYIDDGDGTWGSAWIQNFGGYWVFMNNADSVTGSAATPLPVSEWGIV